MSKPGIAIEPEHCGVCEGVRKLSSCAMCGARVCRFCEREHADNERRKAKKLARKAARKPNA